MAKIEQVDVDTIEEVVDRLGLARVLDMLATICFEKAQHLEGNWQNAASAKQWTKAGMAIDAVSCKPVILEVTY